MLPRPGPGLDASISPPCWLMMRWVMVFPYFVPSPLIAAGITAFLGFQAVVNIGGVIRMLPMTGITLPFVSHGGWSLITVFVMLGMLMAISHRNNTEVVTGQ